MHNKLLLIGLFVILLAVPVLGAEFDNVKENYNAYDKSIEIINFFGIGDKIADIKLIENTDQALINGRAVFEVVLYDDYSGDIVKDVKFYDTLAREKEGEFAWRYWGDVVYSVNVPTYEDVYNKTSGKTESQLTGYTQQLKTRKDWIDYNGGKFESGTYKFELKGKKPSKKSMDFVPTLFGVEIDEFAWWHSDWRNKIQINITENSGATLTDYTIRLNVTWDTGMQTDFDDLRFLNTLENAELGFFTAMIHPSDHAIVYVKVDSITASTITSIYMYFNNTGASSTSDVTEGFINGQLNRSYPANGLEVEPKWYGGINYSFITFLNWSNNSGIHQSIVGWNDSSVAEPTVGFNYHNNVAFEYSNQSDNLFMYAHDDNSNANNQNISNLSYLVGNNRRFSWNVYEVTRYSQNTAFSFNFENKINLSNTTTKNLEILFKATSSCNNINECASFDTNWSGLRKAVYPEPTTINGSSIAFSGNGSIVKNSPINGQTYNGQNLNFTCTGVAVDGTGLNVTNISMLMYNPSDGLEFNILRTYTGSNATVIATHFFNITNNYHGNETFNFNCWICLDDDKCSYNEEEVSGSSSNITFNFDNIFPDLTADTPVIWFNTTDAPLNFTIGAELNLQTCYRSLDGAANVTIGTSNTTVDTGIGSHSVQLYCNDSFGNFNTTNGVVNYSAYRIADIIQNSTSTESAIENFGLIVSNEGNISLEANLNFNNTLYTSTSSLSSGNTTFIREITLPLIESLEVSKNAIWNITGTYNGSSATFQVPNQVQTINQFYISNCSDVTMNATEIALNITFRDEATNVITGSNFTSTITANLQGSSLSKTFGFPQNDTTTYEYYTYCIYPNFTSLVGDIQVVYGGGIYDTRFYASNGRLFDNITDYLDLLLIDIDDSTAITITITDDNDLALEGYAVEAQEYNVINDSYTLTESKVTDPEGIVVLQLDISGGKQYRFVIRDTDGDIVLTVPKFEVTATTYTFQVTPESATGLDQFIDLQQQLTYSLTHSTLTENVTLTWDDTASDLISNGCLRINRKILLNDNNTIIDTCSTDTIGSIIYNLGNESAEFIAIFHATSTNDGKDYVIDAITIDQRTGADLFGLEGVWWAFIIILTITLMTAKIPEIGIMINIVIIYALYAVGMLGISGITITSLIIIGAFIVIKMIRGSV